MIRRTAILATFGVLFAVGCGGAQADVAPTTAGPLVEAEPERVSVRGSSEARATVGRAGGVLSLTNGARLEIPEGAIADEVEVALQVGADGHAFGDAERQRPLGPMLSVEPAIAAANGQPFVLSIPQLPIPSGYEQSDLAFAIEETAGPRGLGTLATQTRWQFYPVHVEDGRLVARVEGFGGHRVQFGVAR